MDDSFERHFFFSDVATFRDSNEEGQFMQSRGPRQLFQQRNTGTWTKHLELEEEKG